MKVKIWGCRGSVAAPGPDTVRYGGNTSCVEVRLDDGQAIVLDAGTGIRLLGIQLAAEGVREVHVLLSHLHMDHIQGLGFFRPLFQKDTTVHIWGPPSPVQSLAERIAIYLSPPLFPVRLAEIPATVVFHDAPDETVVMGSAQVRAGMVTHQGPTVGWRIDADGASMAYLPDHEPAAGLDLTSLPAAWISGADIAGGVDLLLHDTQYFDDEYPNFIGWGHAAVSHTLEFARKADVGQLVLFHHDPLHTDLELDALSVTAAESWNWKGRPVSVAWEGMEIEAAATVRNLAPDLADEAL